MTDARRMHRSLRSSRWELHTGGGRSTASPYRSPRCLSAGLHLMFLAGVEIATGGTPFQRSPAGCFGYSSGGTQSATVNSPATWVKQSKSGGGRRKRRESDRHRGASPSGHRSGCLVAFFASNGCSNMKRAFPRSQIVKAFPKTADRCKCRASGLRSIKEPTSRGFGCWARLTFSRIFRASTGMPG